jgi:hypothetical protein
VSFEVVQSCAPEAPVAIEPAVEFGQARGPDRVDAPRSIDAHVDELRLAQDAQVARHGRLGQAELGLDHAADVAGGPLAGGEQLEYPPPHRVSEDVERLHPEHTCTWAYICPGSNNARRRWPP